MTLGIAGDGQERAIIEVGGEVDLESAPRLAATIAEALSSGRHVVLDLSAVDFLDTSGLGVVLTARRDAARGGVRLSVVAPPDSAARRLLDMTEVSEALVVVDSREQVDDEK